MTKLKLNFNIGDKKASTQTIVAVPSYGDYVSHVFIKIPIYNSKKEQIGWKVADDYVQHLDDNLYSIIINSTYHIFDKGSISWKYSFLKNEPTVYYPLNKVIKSAIISGTGDYADINGSVKLLATADGNRKVEIDYTVFFI
jgi:hypothetical protein